MGNTVQVGDDDGLITKNGIDSINSNHHSCSATKHFLTHLCSLGPESSTNDIKITKTFEKLVISKDFIAAMTMIDEYIHVNFLEHYFSNGSTCIHYASRSNESEFLYFLLNKGMNPNIRHKYSKDTALHSATKKCKIGNIIALMKFNGDPKLINNNGQTCVDIAKMKKNVDVLNIFENYGNNKNHNKRVTFDPIITDVKKDKKSNNSNLLETPSENRHAKHQSSFRWKDVNDIFGRNSITLRSKKHISIPDSDYSDTNDRDNSKRKSGITINVENIDESEDSLSFDENGIEISYSFGKDINIATLVPESSVESTDDDDIDNDEGFATELIISNAIQYNINDSPLLCDWLEILHNNVYPKVYIKSYVFVKSNNIIWNDRKVKFDKDELLTVKERNIYQGCISLLLITDILSFKSSKDKHVYKFELKYDEDKTYLFKCFSKKQRNKWINGLQKCCKNLNNIVTQINHSNNKSQ